MSLTWRIVLGAALGPAPDEIDRVGNLRGEIGLSRAAEIPVGLVAVIHLGIAAAEILGPLAAFGRDLGLEALERQADRGGEERVRNRIGRDGERNGPETAVVHDGADRR